MDSSKAQSVLNSRFASLSGIACDVTEGLSSTGTLTALFPVKPVERWVMPSKGLLSHKWLLYFNDADAENDFLRYAAKDSSLRGTRTTLLVLSVLMIVYFIYSVLVLVGNYAALVIYGSIGIFCVTTWYACVRFGRELRDLRTCTAADTDTGADIYEREVPPAHRLREVTLIRRIEFAAAAGFATSGLIFAFVSYVGRRVCQLTMYSFMSSTSKTDRYYFCFENAHSYICMYIVFSIMCQTPRFAATLLYGVWLPVFFALGHVLATVAPWSDFVISDLYQVVLCGAILVFKYGDEKLRRAAFVRFVELHATVEEVTELSEAARRYEQMIIPPIVRKRLDVDKNFLEFSHCGSCVVIDIWDFASFCTSNLLPSQAAALMVSMQALILRECSQEDGSSGVHRAATRGDTFVGTSNLLTPNPQHVASAASFCRKVQLQLSKTLSTLVAVPIRYSIASGPLFGVVAGATRSRYEVFGQAFLESRAQLQEAGCCPSVVLLSVSSRDTLLRSADAETLSSTFVPLHVFRGDVDDPSEATAIDIVSSDLPDGSEKKVTPAMTRSSTTFVITDLARFLEAALTTSTGSPSNSPDRADLLFPVSLSKSSDPDTITLPFAPELALEESTCTSVHFADPKTQSAFVQARLQRVLPLTALSLVVMGGVLLFGMIIHWATRGGAAPLGQIVVIVALAIFLVLAALAIRAPGSVSRGAPYVAFAVVSVAVPFIVISGLSLLRPSWPGNDTTYIFVVFLGWVPFFPLPPKPLGGMALVVAVDAFLLVSFFIFPHSALNDTTLLMVVLPLPIIGVYIWRQGIRLSIADFLTTETLAATKAELTRQLERRLAVASSTVPRFLVEPVLDAADPSGLYLSGAGEMLVCMVRMDELSKLEVPGVSAAPEGAAPTVQLSEEGLLATVTKSFDALEMAVEEHPRDLSLCKPLGDTVLVIGDMPPEDLVAAPQLRELRLHDSVLAMLSVVNSLQHCGSTLSCVCVIESGGYVLVMDSYPSFEVTGVAFQRCRALMEAAPPGQALCTELFFNASTVATEKSPPSAFEVSFGRPTPWRMRGLGKLTVRSMATTTAL